MRIEVIDQGPWKGRRAELKPGVGVTLGSDPSCTLSLPGAPGVEGTHCVIRALKQGGFGVKDLGSQEGTFLNGKRVKVARLRPGDLLRVGSVTLEVREGPGEAPARDEPARRTGKAPEEPAPSPEPGGNAPSRSAQGRARGKLPPRKRDLERVGTELGGYKILEFLGRGGMGTVYRALQVSLQREVALKLLRRERTRDPAFVEAFLREARAAARFNHPNVVHVYDVGNEGDVYFYSMELMDRGSLEEELAERGKLPWEEALKVIRDAARGLRYAEEMGLVHRDIKPDNLMRNSQGVTKIADLGLAAAVGEGESEEEEEEGRKKKIFGTPHFISPEQARGEAVDIRSDIYSLGCTFYRLVTGRNPFQGDSVREILRKHFTEEAEPASQAEPSVPDAVSRVIQKMMAKDPADRYQSVQELLSDLDGLGGRKGGRKWISLLLAAALLAGALAVVLGRKEPPPRVRPPKDDTRIQEKVREVERTRRELEAQKALLQAKEVSGDKERAARLEKLARDFSGTEAAREAARLASALREKIARAEKARREKAARIRTCLKALGEVLSKAEKAGDGALLFRSLPTVPRLEELSREPQVAQALERVRRKAAALLSARAARLLKEAGNRIKKGDLKGAGASLEEARKLLADPALPADLRARLEKRLRPRISLLEKARAREKERLRALQAKADRDVYLLGLFRGPGSALARSRRFDFAGALQAARALEKKLHTRAFRNLLAARTAQIERAGRAWKAFLQDLSRGGNGPVLMGGKAWKVRAFEGGRKLVLEERLPPGRTRRTRGKRTRPAETTLVLGEKLLLERPAVLASLLDPERRSRKDPASLGDLALLCAWIGPCPQAARARAWMDRIRPEDPKSGLASSPPSFDAPLLDLADRILARAAGSLSPDETRLVRTEIQASRLLSRGLRAFAMGHNLEAADALERIASSFPESVLYGILGEGGALDPDKPAPPAEK